MAQQNQDDDGRSPATEESAATSGRRRRSASTGRDEDADEAIGLDSTDDGDGESDAPRRAFVRSLEAYRATLKGRTTMVLPPDHEFFRFLDPRAGERARRSSPPAPPEP